MTAWKVRAAAVALFAFIAAPAQAGTLNPFTSLWVLGDFLATPETSSPTPAGRGRRARPISRAASRTDRSGPSTSRPPSLPRAAQSATSRAVGRGRCPTRTACPTCRSSSASLPSTPNGRLGDRPLGAVWFGANDLIATIGTPGQTRAARRAANALAAGVVALALIGIEDTLVFNLPDLGRTPAYNLFQPQVAALASAATRTFNTTLDRRLDALRSAGYGVGEVDVFAAFNDVLDNPGRYGIADPVRPCIFPPEAGARSARPPRRMLRAFFDPLHPNAVLHREVAALAERTASPIPLPASAWLLAGALGLLAYQRRTRRPRTAPAPATIRIASTYQTPRKADCRRCSRRRRATPPPRRSSGPPSPR